MKTTKSTATVFELEGGQIVIGARSDSFFVKTSDGIMEYLTEEMEECYGLTLDQLINMKYVLS